MTEQERKIICWSCKAEEVECICEDGFIPLIVTPPKIIMPVCGGTEYVDAPWNDSKRYLEVMPRPCCQCDESWLSNHHDHLYGACPHCGAKGIDGMGGKIATG